MDVLDPHERGQIPVVIDPLAAELERAVPPKSLRCGHSVQFYLSDEALAASVAGFVSGALAAGDAVVIAATPEHQAAVCRLLGDAGEIEHLAAPGRLVWLDARSTLDAILRDGAVDPALFDEVIGGVVKGALAAAAGPSPRVSVYGELVALLSAEGKHDQAIALEQCWNELIAACPITLHCGYPLHCFPHQIDGDAVAHICEAHEAVVPAEDFPISGREDEQRRATVLLQQRSYAANREVEARRRVEEALSVSQFELSSMRTLRDDFLVAAAHELKTPVTSLRVYAQMLQRDVARNNTVPPERLTRSLQAIERQTVQLNALVNRLLDVAQLEAGTLQLSLERCDLVPLVQCAAEQHLGSHQLVLDLPQQLTATCDCARLEQIVTILLANAAKFSPPGSRIEVCLRRDGEAIRLSVTDEGRGVPPGEQERIFERFHRAHNQRNLSGFGLGLYVARGVLELHGGTIRVEQPEHPGARFVVELPADLPLPSRNVAFSA